MENIRPIILSGEDAKKFIDEYLHPKCNKLGEEYSRFHISYCDDHIEVEIDDTDIQP